MLDTILLLIEKCLLLVKRQESLNRQHYADFVEPAFKDFEALHSDYSGSFRRYREILESIGEPLTPNHPILQEIRKDNLFSEDLRAKLWALAENSDLDYDSLRGFTIKEAGSLESFLFRLLQYLCNSSQLPERMTSGYDVIEDGIPVSEFPLRGQYIRTGAIQGLEKIFSEPISDDDKRESAVACLDGLFASVQANHSSVVLAHLALKQRLLKPR